MDAIDLTIRVIKCNEARMFYLAFWSPSGTFKFSMLTDSVNDDQISHLTPFFKVYFYVNNFFWENTFYISKYTKLRYLDLVIEMHINDFLKDLFIFKREVE